MGNILSYKHGEGSVTGVDPRLWDIVQNAIAVSPYDAVIRSGAEKRSTNGGNHNPGWAVDVTLVDPKTREKIPDYQNGKSFATYEQFAQAARVYQQANYPELDSKFRWGGYFGSKNGTSGYGAVDLMHLDINPNMKGATSLGNWDSGAAQALLDAYPGAVTNGGLAGGNGPRLVTQYQEALKNKGKYAPPLNVGADAPTPMPARPFGSTEPAAPVPRQRPTVAALGPQIANGLNTLSPPSLSLNPPMPERPTNWQQMGGARPYTPAPSPPLAPLGRVVANGGAALGGTAVGSAKLSAAPIPTYGSSDPLSIYYSPKPAPKAPPQPTAAEKAALAYVPPTSGAIRTLGQAGNVAMPLGARPASIPDIAVAAPTVDETRGEQALMRARPAAPASPVPAAAPKPVAPGPTAFVTTVQHLLNTQGFSPGKTDGLYGPKTDAAVRAFQQANGLKVDGIVGPKTLAALKVQPAAPAPKAAPAKVAPIPAPRPEGVGSKGLSQAGQELRNNMAWAF
jgi:hypothetical protein